MPLGSRARSFQMSRRARSTQRVFLPKPRVRLDCAQELASRVAPAIKPRPLLAAESWRKAPCRARLERRALSSPRATRGVQRQTANSTRSATQFRIVGISWVSCFRRAEACAGSATRSHLMRSRKRSRAASIPTKFSQNAQLAHRLAPMVSSSSPISPANAVRFQIRLFAAASLGSTSRTGVIISRARPSKASPLVSLATLISYAASGSTFAKFDSRAAALEVPSGARCVQRCSMHVFRFLQAMRVARSVSHFLLPSVLAHTSRSTRPALQRFEHATHSNPILRVHARTTQSRPARVKQRVER